MNNKTVKIVSTILIISLFSVGAYLISDGINTDFKYNGMYSDSIINNDVPVVNLDTKICKPFNSDKVEETILFYDYENADTQEKSIIYYDNTYMQSTGIVYGSDTQFDVVSIYDGEVINVEDNELLGNTIEIKHSNNLISVYQCLTNLKVKKGDIVKKGDFLASSNKSNLNKDKESILYFELILEGKIVNPSLYLEKDINNL